MFLIDQIDWGVLNLRFFKLAHVREIVYYILEVVIYGLLLQVSLMDKHLWNEFTDNVSDH